MKELKEYTDKDGYTFKYYDIDDLCFEMICQSCRLESQCEKYNEFDCCYEYNEKLEELKKKGIK